jgi:outer membrane protein OmpA-like peptidoglycan-associated protein/tetratricopeptide (TPR) repeat protein
MKKIIYISTLLFSFASFAQTHVEFEKSNFKDKKEGYSEAKDAYKDGKELFEKARQEFESYKTYYVSIHNYYPVSVFDYRQYGYPNFKLALPLLEKAYAFNPNHAELNYMLGIIYFNLDTRKDRAIQRLEAAQKLKPGVAPDVFFFIGWSHHLHMDWDLAIDNYKKFRDIVKATPKFDPLAIDDVNKKISECELGKGYTGSPQRIVVENLGKNVNSSFADYSALISTDESTLIFTSRRDNSTGQKKDETGEYYEDVYISNFVNGAWTPAANMGPPINTDDHDAPSGLSPDGTILYLYKLEKKDGGDIYQSVLQGTTWSKPEHLNKNINSKFHESSVSISSDNKTLYFVSDRDGGLGERDIYMSKKDDKGNWGTAINLGPAINTRYAEEGVFIHPDGKTMYFSSKGHSTMGGFDIFKSTFENGFWTPPVNLGYPVNGPGDDVFFVVNASGRRGYFTSDKEEGFGEKDLYMLTFLGPEKPFATNGEDNLIASAQEPIKAKAADAVEIKAAELTILKGTITDAFTKNPLEASIDLIDNVKNEVLATFKSNSVSGKYLVSLPSGKNYGIAVRKDGYLFHSENFDIPAGTGYQEFVKDVELKNVAVGSVIVLRNIFFDFDKATLRPESTNELERLIKLLNDLPTLKIEIGSHTDSKGSDDYNMKLSQARSESVVNYLISHGIAKDRLVAQGYGETKPIASNDTDEGRQQNRRSEFKILSK